MNVYSLDEERYYEYEEFLDIIEIEGRPDFVYVAEKTKQSNANFIEVDWIIEQIQDKAYDKAGELSDNYLIDITTEDKAELHNLIANWLDEKRYKPDFFLVDGVEKITYEEFKQEA